jgi:Ni/Co efflux regulator RcnB
MKPFRSILLGVAASLVLSAAPALAQDHGNGHAKGHEKHDAKWDDGDEYRYSHHEEAIHDWYTEKGNHLPPGLAKKDRLPPGLEKQLAVRGTLPPGLQKRIYPCPEDLEHRLPPPPPDCAHVLIGGHIVLLNHKTNVVVDVFHFEAF